jgi:uncharacterized protein
VKNLSLLAELKPTTEFIAAVEEHGVDVTIPSENGQSLLMSSLVNPDLDARYESTTWLLDHGAQLGQAGSDGVTELHVLFGSPKHRVGEDVRIARRLIELGADVNAVSSRAGLVFCEVLWMKLTDDELAPIYDLWFEQPGPLDFTTPAAQNGREPLGMARALPYRASILERMERYVAEHS